MRPIHGASTSKGYTPEYESWQAMIQRCTNKNRADYHHYGGRGITICDRWRHDFVQFLADMKPRPEGKSLDRIDVNGNYEPSNCRWATQKQQVNNRRKFVDEDYYTSEQTEGKFMNEVTTRALLAWCEECGEPIYSGSKHTEQVSDSGNRYFYCAGCTVKPNTPDEAKEEN